MTATLGALLGIGLIQNNVSIQDVKVYYRKKSAHYVKFIKYDMMEALIAEEFLEKFSEKSLKPIPTKTRIR